VRLRRGPRRANIPAAPGAGLGLFGALTQSAGKSTAGLRTGSFGSRNGRCVYWLATRLGLVSHETHLSAEEAQASEDSRFPRADAHARGATHAQAAARQGPQALDRLMRRPAGTRPRSNRSRLTRSADFDRVFRSGRSHAGRELVLYVFPRGEDGPPRLGLSVSRKVGGAVERNRVKRLLREAFAVESARLPEGTDAVVVARPDARSLAEREGLAGIQHALGDLIDKAGGGAGGGAADRGAEA
jgi:ribonuclease P protein component